jgi:hypothetical protein
MVKQEKFDRFKGGRSGAIYVCVVCGKKTRETGDGESANRLCRKCYIEAGMENEISDGYVKCPKCGENQDIKIIDEQFVCNKCGNTDGKWYRDDY